MHPAPQFALQRKYDTGGRVNDYYPQPYLPVWFIGFSH
jgi:hypothetical protein